MSTARSMPRYRRDRWNQRLPRCSGLDAGVTTAHVPRHSTAGVSVAGHGVENLDQFTGHTSARGPPTGSLRTIRPTSGLAPENLRGITPTDHVDVPGIIWYEPADDRCVVLVANFPVGRHPQLGHQWSQLTSGLTADRRSSTLLRTTPGPRGDHRSQRRVQTTRGVESVPEGCSDGDRTRGQRRSGPHNVWSPPLAACSPHLPLNPDRRVEPVLVSVPFALPSVDVIRSPVSASDA